MCVFPKLGARILRSFPVGPVWPRRSCDARVSNGTATAIPTVSTLATQPFVKEEVPALPFAKPACILATEPSLQNHLRGSTEYFRLPYPRFCVKNGQDGRSRALSCDLHA